MDREITFEVPGLPPLKYTDVSVFSKRRESKASAERLRHLLERARGVLPADGGIPFRDSDCLGLEVVIESQAVDLPGDATNYLGGIADVLEDKSCRERQSPNSLDHLGELRKVAVYPDDRQIREIRYRHRRAGADRYTVRLWVLRAEVR